MPDAQPHPGLAHLARRQRPSLLPGRYRVRRRAVWSGPYCVPSPPSYGECEGEHSAIVHRSEPFRLKLDVISHPSNSWVIRVLGHLEDMPSSRSLSDSDPLWYKDAIIYEVHVRAYADSSGDGMGDFAGLTEKLEYLQDLGVTAIWVLPFCPSPWRDDGYDIADYTDVHPAYGTLKDFQAFLKEAH